MTDSTQPQDVAGAASDTGQGMPGTDRASSVDVAMHAPAMRATAMRATAMRATAMRALGRALGRAPWRTLPPAEPWRSPEPRRSAP